MNKIGCYVEIIKEERGLGRFDLYKNSSWPSEEIRKKANEKEWDLHGFSPVKGNVGEVIGIVHNDIHKETIYVILILGMFYVPISESAIEIITREQYLKKKNAQIEIIKSSTKYFDLQKDKIIKVVIRNGYFGYKDNHDNLICNYQYQMAYSFVEGRALIQKDDKWGFIDYDGNEVINPIFVEANSFNEKRAIVKDYKYFSINRSGDTYSRKYDFMQDYKNGLSLVCLNRQWGFIDINGVEKIPLKYDWGFNFHNEVAIVKKDMKYGAINNQGYELLDCKYDFVGGASRNRHFAVQMNKKWGLVVGHGSKISEMEYDSMYIYSDELFVCQKEGRYGFVNDNNEIKIPFIYEKASVFVNGIAMVVKNNKIGYIDVHSNIIIPFFYDEGENESGGLISVKKGEKWGVINRSGDVVIPFKLDRCCWFKDEYAEVYVDDILWLVNKEGAFIRKI